jgi:radical SAM superfamily enzyme YgiQ (UPF0313 family)
VSTGVAIIVQAPTRKGLYANVLPPIGPLGLASYLTSRTVPCAVFDCFVQEFQLRDIEPFGIVGFSINISNMEKSLETISLIKCAFPQKKIAVGGPLCTSDPAFFTQNPCIDAVFVGEAEESLWEYAAAVGSEPIRGVYIRAADGRWVYTGPRPYCENLDSLPFPALDQVRIERYNSPIKKALPISNLISSRGCPYGCIFCFKTMGSRWRARSAGNVVDEVQWQVEKFGVREICIYDDNFTMDMQRAEEICDGILRRGIRVHLQLTNGVRVDRLSEPLLKKLKAAGLWIIGLAPETGSEETLRRINKGFDLKRTLEVASWCRTLGIRTWSFFMIGFPWETEEDIEQTIRFAERLDTEFTQFTRVTPFPQTALYSMMQQEYNMPSSPQGEIGLFYGGVPFKHKHLAPNVINKMIKRAYRRVYLKPRKMLRLLRTLRFRDLLALAFYSLRTGNV